MPGLPRHSRKASRVVTASVADYNQGILKILLLERI